MESRGTLYLLRLKMDVSRSKTAVNVLNIRKVPSNAVTVPVDPFMCAAVYDTLSTSQNPAGQVARN